VSAYPNSVGTTRPRLAMPADACDAHMHIYDPWFPAGTGMVAQAAVADYRRIQARLGTTRTVVVTPRASGTDNRGTLSAIAQLGFEHARGIAVVTPEVTDAELAHLHAGGIRGIRFTLYTPENAPTTFEMVEALARRVHELGWHVQLHWTADQIVEHVALLQRLPATLVFDHLARLPMPQGASHPAFRVVQGLLAEGRAWVKLSGAYLDSVVGAAGDYVDIEPVARAWVAAAPQRLVWGSDWPHPTENTKPDDAQLADLLPRWAGDGALCQQILVDNPAALYDF